MKTHYDIIIAGGGLAGLTAALLLSKRFKVLVIDPDDYPRHKMCGEYLSAEVADFLKSEGIDLDQHTDYKLSQLTFTTETGKLIQAALPLGGYGISRYKLDYEMYKIVVQRATFIMDKVTDMVQHPEGFSVITVSGLQLECKQAIMATGKRSNLDKSLNREFIDKKSPWLAVKRHYNYDMPADQVQLHNFDGGYAGLSKVENGHVNLCYLSTFKSFKRYKNVDAFNESILAQNPQLRTFFEKSTAVWDQPISISQISFEQKSPVERGIIMIGDTAGLIHPLCGNGMAMAIHSGKLAADAITPYLNGQHTHEQSLNKYHRLWNLHFKSRLRMGRWLQGILLHPVYTRAAFRLLRIFPFLLPIIIKKTHGKPI